MHSKLKAQAGPITSKKLVLSTIARISLVISMLVGAFSPAHAVLIELDLDAQGDRLLTLDSNSGLEWLDVTATTGLTFNQARASNYVTAQSFRHATIDEVSTLHSNVGFLPQSSPLLNDPFIYAPYYNYEFAREIIEKLGCTDVCSSNSFNFQNGLVEGLPGTPELAQAASVYTDTVTAPWGFSRVPFNPVSTFYKDTFQLPQFGHYLVRVHTPAIPEPSSLITALFGISTFFILRVFVGRRRRQCLPGVN